MFGSCGSQALRDREARRGGARRAALGRHKRPGAALHELRHAEELPATQAVPRRRVPADNHHRRGAVPPAPRRPLRPADRGHGPDRHVSADDRRRRRLPPLRRAHTKLVRRLQGEQDVRLRLRLDGQQHRGRHGRDGRLRDRRGRPHDLLEARDRPPAERQGRHRRLEESRPDDAARGQVPRHGAAQRALGVRRAPRRPFYETPRGLDDAARLTESLAADLRAGFCRRGRPGRAARPALVPNPLV